MQFFEKFMVLELGKNEVEYVLSTLSLKMIETVARKTLEAKKQTYEKTNDGPMKRPCSTVIRYEKILCGP